MARKHDEQELTGWQEDMQRIHVAAEWVLSSVLELNLTSKRQQEGAGAGHQGSSLARQKFQSNSFTRSSEAQFVLARAA